MTVHGRAADYLDGTLAPAEEQAFVEHAADCAECEADLHAEVQLRDREAGLAEVETVHSVRPSRVSRPIRPPVAVTPPAARSRRTWPWVALASGLAAAAVVALVVTGGTGERTPVPELALAEHRSLPIRLSNGAAARHRPYDEPRSGDAPSEQIPATTIDALERARDCHGVGTALLLDGQYRRAEQAWKDCVVGSDLEADRAGLAVLEGRHREALASAEQVLAVQPHHPVAVWNRALALEAIGRRAEAAEAFDRAAELGDDWAAEARARAAALRRP